MRVCVSDRAESATRGEAVSPSRKSTRFSSWTVSTIVREMESEPPPPNGTGNGDGAGPSRGKGAAAQGDESSQGQANNQTVEARSQRMRSIILLRSFYV